MNDLNALAIISVVLIGAALLTLREAKKIARREREKHTGIKQD